MNLWESVTNQKLQSDVFQNNIEYAFNYLNNELGIFHDIPDIQWNNIFQSFKSRVQNNNNFWAKRKLQLDLIALYLLVKNWYDFWSLEEDLCDIFSYWNWQWVVVSSFFEILENFIWKQLNQTELSIELPKIMKDALKSIETEGREPPAWDLEKAVIYFWDAAFNTIQAYPEL